MDWLNSDEREMEEFVNSNNWYVPGTQPTPSPGVGSNVDFTSPVNTDEFEVSEMEPATSRGKAKAGEDDGPKKYSPAETLWLARVYIDVAEDPIIGNQQTGKVFWERIAQKYNAGRPTGSIERSYVKLRKHWARVQADMSKWNGKWANVVRMWPSGHSEADLVEKAKEAFYLDGTRAFKYLDVWKLVEKSPKFYSGVEATSASKRTKVSASGTYSSSGGCPPIDLNVTDEDAFVSSPSIHSRPTGTKAAKRKAKGKATSSTYTSVPPPINPSLDKIADTLSDMNITWRMSQLTELTSRDTSQMSAEELELHREMIAYLRAQMKK